MLPRESLVKGILTELASLYPLPKSELNFSNPFETLVAAILSAHCSDVQVNRATAALFADCPDAASMAALEPEQLEPYIRSVGLYHAKARNVSAACRIIVNEHGGDVPDDFDALMRLPGVGRKVANVVIANAFDRPAFAVDTHVQRVSNRLGLAHSKTPEQTERQLTQTVPESEWAITHHRIIYHGRRVCHARKPECGTCTLRGMCQYASHPEADA